jgi:hypothetical protein
MSNHQSLLQLKGMAAARRGNVRGPEIASRSGFGPRVSPCCSRRPSVSSRRSVAGLTAVVERAQQIAAPNSSCSGCIRRADDNERSLHQIVASVVFPRELKTRHHGGRLQGQRPAMAVGSSASERTGRSVTRPLGIGYMPHRPAAAEGR